MASEPVVLDPARLTALRAEIERAHRSVLVLVEVPFGKKYYRREALRALERALALVVESP